MGSCSGQRQLPVECQFCVRWKKKEVMGNTIFSTSASVAGWMIAEGVCLFTSVQRDIEVLNAADSGSRSICASLERITRFSASIVCCVFR
jgi:hypothetical protein